MRLSYPVAQIIFVCLLATLLCLCVTKVSLANTITVDTLIDTDMNTGLCSLRTAIYAANVDQQVDGCPSGNGADTILVPAGVYSLTIPNTSAIVDEDGTLTGDLDISGTLRLMGAGAEQTVLLGNVDRVLEILSGAQVTVTNLTLRDGNAFFEAGGGHPDGGGLLNSGQLWLQSVEVVHNNVVGSGGGIFNAGWLSMAGTVVSDNYSQPTKYGVLGGGGVGNTGTLMMKESTISNNIALYPGGGIENSGDLLIDDSQIVSNTTYDYLSWVCCSIEAYGGGIHNGGVLTITSSSVSYNLQAARQTAAYHFCRGAGIYNSGRANIRLTSISHNQINACVPVINTVGISISGGGIYNTGMLSLESSTIYSNIAQAGAGMVNDGFGQANLINITISANRAITDGGGMMILGGVVSSTNSTIADNAAINGAGVYALASHFEITPVVGILNLHNTILANHGENCTNSGGEIISLSHNLSSDASCTAALHQPGDLNNTDPKLGPLSYNFPGTTPTYALLVDSLAIDAGDNQNAPAVDQRGWPRPEGEAVDIGAYEYNGSNQSLFLPLIMQ